MNRFGDAIRIPLGNTGKDREGGQVRLDDLTCSRLDLLSGDGASGLVYVGYSPDYYGPESPVDAKLIVKECYPVEVSEQLVRKGDMLAFREGATEEAMAVFSRYAAQYKNAFASHAKLYQGAAREQIVVPNKACDANGTTYLVSDASNGDVMDIAFERMETSDQINALLRVSEAIAAIHDSGYVYLDLKPNNILCIKNSDESSGNRYTGEIKLFDFDTATPIADLSDANTLISGSGDWSSHEQTHPGYRENVGIQSDVYSLGALLFWVVVGRPPKPNEVIYAAGKWELSSRDCSNLDFRAANEQVFRCLRKILNSTLTVEPRLRYKTTKPLIDDLSLLYELLLPVRATHSQDHAAMMSKLEEIASRLERFDSTLDSPNIAEPKKRSKRSPKDEEGQNAPESCEALDSDDDLDEPDFDGEVFEEDDAIDDAFYLRGYEAANILEMLENDDRISANLHDSIKSMRLELQDAFRKRDTDAARIATYKAMGIAQASTRIVMANMWVEALEDNGSRRMASIVEAKIRELEAGIIEANDEAVLQKLSKRLNRCCSGLSAALIARKYLDSLERHLSDEMKAELIDAIEAYEDALGNGGKGAIKKSGKRLDAKIEKAKHDAYFGMISERM